VRLVCYDDRPALLDGESVVELSPLLTDPSGSAGELMLAVIDQWAEVRSRLAAGALATLPRTALDHSMLGPPIPRPGKIVAAPVNYDEHRVEMSVQHTVAQLGVFLKAPSSVIGPGGTILLPFADRRTDQEAELAVVIGSTAHHVTADRALDHVFGYTCLLDVTLRGDEERSMRKSFDTFTPIGSCITTADEVADPDDLRLRCWVNGELRQDSSTARLIYGVAHLIEYVSAVMTLDPGDIISTGTPAGVGPLMEGDRVVVEVERVGRLEVGVRIADASHLSTPAGSG
jgi:2-keto-4-pentenoate hydratase/2-oxohepta-3-ene-1,7-dioic acid hydratase in catechol pathway